MDYQGPLSNILKLITLSFALILGLISKILICNINKFAWCSKRKYIATSLCIAGVILDIIILSVIGWRFMSVYRNNKFVFLIISYRPVKLHLLQD